MRTLLLTLSALLLLGADCTASGVDACTDADGDGWCADLDCDDDNAETYPGAVEVCDGLDNDCDDSIQGVTDWAGDEFDDEVDRDGDGWLNCDDCAITQREVGGPRDEVCPDA
jgi:hypothetical protein